MFFFSSCGCGSSLILTQPSLVVLLGFSVFLFLWILVFLWDFVVTSCGFGWGGSGVS